MEFRSITHAFQVMKTWQIECCDISVFVNAHFADTLNAKKIINN